MLFFLDHDVDVAVGTVIRRAGHRCHSIGSAGMATASDDDVSVFADNRGGTLLTHDRELLRRRRRNTFGHHILLRCNEWEAVGVVRDHLDKVVAAVAAHREALCATLTHEGLKIHPRRWL